MSLPDDLEKMSERSRKRARLAKLAIEKETARIESRRFWHNTPLMLALVGTISVFANGIVSYVQAYRTTSDTVTLEQLKSQLKESESRSAAARASESSEAEAKRLASKEEREFAFKIIERELAKTGNSSSRAEILLFLARAGILNSLNRTELETMALTDIVKAGKPTSDIGIPPTLGREMPLVSLEAVQLEKVLSIEGLFSPINRHEVRLLDCSTINVDADEAALEAKLVGDTFVRLNWQPRLWVRRTAVDAKNVGQEGGKRRLTLDRCSASYLSSDAQWSSDLDALLAPVLPPASPK